MYKKKTNLRIIYDVVDYIITDLQLMMVNITPFLFCMTFIVLISIHSEEPINPNIYRFTEGLGYLLIVWLANTMIKRIFNIGYDKE